MVEFSHLICNLTMCSHEVEPVEGDSVEMDVDWMLHAAVQFMFLSGRSALTTCKAKDVGIDHVTKLARQAHQRMSLGCGRR